MEVRSDLHTLRASLAEEQDDQWRLKRESFQILDHLGTGSFGTVCCALFMQTGGMFALKRCSKRMALRSRRKTSMLTMALLALSRLF